MSPYKTAAHFLYWRKIQMPSFSSNALVLCKGGEATTQVFSSASYHLFFIEMRVNNLGFCPFIF